MNFIDNIMNIVKRIFGADPVVTQNDITLMNVADSKYRDQRGYNLTAIFASKLATFTMTDSGVEVIGGNQRAELINDAIQRIWMKSKKWVGCVYGTGGVVLIPYVIDGHVYIDIVPQSSMVINRVNGDELRAVSIVADSTIQNNKQYFRWTDYSLEDNGTLTIRQRATNAMGTAVPLSSLAEWTGIVEEMTISGLEHLPLAYIKNPTDNRHTDSLYGVPVTYGCDEKIAEVIECQDKIRREYRLKEPIVGMDTTLFKTENGHRHLPVTGLFMPVTPSGLNTSGKLWDVYDPAIRDSSYYNRLQHLYEELEKQVGTSRGILTERITGNATATEIKAANYDTYSIIDDMRKVIAPAMERLAYAIDVLANAYNLTPMGEYELAFDWSYALIESSQESFNQLLSSVTVDAVEPAELRQFSFPNESIEEARQRVAEIKQAKAEEAESADLMLQRQLALEAQRG